MKVFIDVFIGIWAFILAVVWCTKIEGRPGEKVPLRQIWDRFPKFVLGFIVAFFNSIWIVVGIWRSGRD